MGNAQSAARIIAPISFLYDFAAQQYGMFSSPNMLDIHNKNLAAFSPQPYFIAGFFFPQQLFQLSYLWKLWNGQGNAAERETMEKYAWAYSLGNFCIGSKETLSSMSDISLPFQRGCSSGTRTT
jgi:hypothetical protein